MSEFKSTSQAGQDRFVLAVLDHPTTGTFLDIGSGHPIDYSNTCGLERLGWRGLCIDMGDVANIYAQHRISPFVRDNAETCDFMAALKFAGLSTSLDYLSLDVDEATLSALCNLPLATTRFKVITIEHDRYRFGQLTADAMRARLTAHGYTLVCQDVTSLGKPFEDWWVDLEQVNQTVVDRLRCQLTDGLSITRRASVIQDWFDKIFIINLDRRHDRWIQAQAELTKLSINAERFSGYDSPLYESKPNGNFGCTASHRALLELIAYNQWRRTLVLEDDFVSLHDDPNSLFTSLIDQVPPDWDMLYLGGHYGEPPIARVSPGLIRCASMLTTSSYAITHQHARRIAPYISGIGPIDNLYSGFARSHNHYIFQPRLFAQRTSLSDLCGEVRENITCMTDTRHENMV